MMSHSKVSPLCLHHAGQRLALLPDMGGGVAAWQMECADGTLVDLWRPWDGQSEDMYSLASFAMLPWSNRIGSGGFACEGKFHAIQANRLGEPYPIHGEGWLQPWRASQLGDGVVEMHLSSCRHLGSPYEYQAYQRFSLVDGGLDQSIEVCHQAAQPLPYGLGLHPWFPRTANTRVLADVDGVWLSASDPMPTSHSITFPHGWELRNGISAYGSLIDNAYSGWNGQARIDWPERNLSLTLRQTAPLDGELFCLVYRPPAGETFCFEPMTHPINAFHLKGQPGLRLLHQGQRLRLEVQWRFHELDK